MVTAEAEDLYRFYQARAKGVAGGYSIRILHLSDIHFRAVGDPGERAKGSEEFVGKIRKRAEKIRVETPRRHEVMASEAWRRNIRALLENGGIDLVCATGDIADWGWAEEFELATEFFTDLLDQLGLGWERLFVVPGNYDVDRLIEADTWKALRAYGDEDERSRWMAGGGSLRGVEDEDSAREQILRRQGAFRHWLVKVLGRDELDPGGSATLDTSVARAIGWPGPAVLVVVNRQK